MKAFIAYYRVSTDQQKRSGLGLLAQQNAVAHYLERCGGKLLNSFTEIESGRNPGRAELLEAVRLSRVYKATLLVARLDRMARNVALVSALMESNVEFVAADMPLANRFTLHLIAAVAEYESELISQRVRGARAVALAQGRKLGGNSKGCKLACWTAESHAKSTRVQKAKADKRAKDLAPLLCALRDRGESMAGIAQYLGFYGILTAHGHAYWNRGQVARYFTRSGERPPRIRATRLTADQRLEQAKMLSLVSLFT